ncbi:hypothetical protein PLICRDRAFT_112234, partial [Plicaturopsis crispa FD-325 SS-3]
MASTTVLAPAVNLPVFSPASLSSPSPASDSRRQSAVSSAATSTISFQTARSSNPPTAASQNSLRLSSSSRSSSTHTLSGVASPPNRISEDINPFHHLTRPNSNGISAPEVHIVKVTNDTVHLAHGPVPDSLFRRVGKSIANAMP